MKLFLFVMCVLFALDMGIRLLYLCQNEYPRHKKHEAHVDVGVVVIQASFLLWIAQLLNQLGP